MFETIERNRKASGRKALTVLISIVAHVVIIGVVVVVPLLYMSDKLPAPPEFVSAFVTAPAPPAPPPPPPPPANAPPPEPKPVATTGQALAPVAPPSNVAPEVGAPARSSSDGVPGGVVGGIAGGVAGGTVGGLPDAAPAPSGAPVRVGGRIKAPDLVHQVQPAYPQIAKASHVQGVVIIEATVDTAGRVTAARVLRGNGLLNEAAIEAVKQWRYSPLMLNGQPTPFILTVTVTFRLE